MLMLNLGCGGKFHKDWVNLDFIPRDPLVKHCDLSQGIPYDDESCDVVYHSHLLEHLDKQQALKFLEENYRVLKKKGILRIAVPDFEGQVKAYLDLTSKALRNDKDAINNYEWIVLEIIDQFVRDQSGGLMQEYLLQDNLKNREYIVSRIGKEALDIISNKNAGTDLVPERTAGFRKKIIFSLRGILYKYVFKRIMGFPDKTFAEFREKYALGVFRSSGEIHKWIYDRYSLTSLLSAVGFKNISQKNTEDSAIPGWTAYQLEAQSGLIYKPDSLILEAAK